MSPWCLRELEATALHVPIVVRMQHSDFAVLTVSWELALRADGYADNTVKAYQNAVRSLADWRAEHHPQVGPAQLERQYIRGGLVEVRERHTSTRPEAGSPGPALSAAGPRARARPTRTPRRDQDTGSGRS